MAIKVPIVSEFNNTGLVQANTALAKFGVTSQAELNKAAAGFGVLAVAGVKAFSALDAGYDAIQEGTGATGDALDGLTKSAENVARTVPNSFADVGAAIAEVNSRLGLTGKPLEDMTKRFLDLARVTKTDVKTAIADTTRVFGDWGIAVEDQTLTIDKLLAATQETGVGFDQLSQQVVQFGAPLRQLGFSFDEATALLAKFEQEGVNSEAVLAGMKVGLNNLAKAGESPAEAFRRLITEIGNMEDAGARVAAAGKIFGTRAGADLAAAMAEGRFATEDLVAVLGQAEGALADTAEGTLDADDKLRQLANQLLVSSAPALEKFADFAMLATSALTGLPGPVQTVVVGAAALALAVKSAQAALNAFTTTAMRAKIATSGIGTVITAVAVPAMIAYGIHTQKMADKNAEFEQSLTDLGRAADDALTDQFVTAMLKGAFAGKSFEESLGDIAQSVPGAVARMVELEDSTGAVTRELVAGGLSAKDAALYVDGLRGALAAEKVAVDNAAKSQEAANKALETGITVTDDYTSTVDNYTAAQVAVQAAIDAAKRAEDDGTAAKERGARASEEAAAAARAQAEATWNAAHANMSAEEALWDQIEAIERFNEVSADEEASLIDKARAANDVIRATEAQVIATNQLTEADLQSTAGRRTFTAGMLEAARTMQDPLRREVLAYIADVNGIPPEKITNILADTADALRQLAIIDAELRRVTRDRTVRVNVQLTGGGPTLGTHAEDRGIGDNSLGRPIIVQSAATGSRTGGGVTVPVTVTFNGVVTTTDVEQWARTELVPLLQRLSREFS